MDKIDLKKKEEASSFNADFGRCRSCGAIRWVTPNAVREKGPHCQECGAHLIIHAFKVHLKDRWPLLRWFLWEVGVMNGKGWWKKNLLTAGKVLWIGLHPKLERREEASG